MIDCYKQEWNNKLTQSDRYKMYRSFKSILQHELYLQMITIIKFRTALIRFRLGINELRVNQRYGNITETKKCPFCDDIENEIHFILKCPMYTQLRNKYLTKHYQTKIYKQPFNFLLQNEDKHILRDLAMFIHYALLLREQTI